MAIFSGFTKGVTKLLGAGTTGGVNGASNAIDKADKLVVEMKKQQTEMYKATDSSHDTLASLMKE